MSREDDPRDQDEQTAGDDLDLEEPSTESLGRSPVTGQTAADSQNAPGR